MFYCGSDVIAHGGRESEMQHGDWPDRIRTEMVAPQVDANRKAAELERKGKGADALTLRIFGRLNGIENGLVALSEQLEEMHRASGR